MTNPQHTEEPDPFDDVRRPSLSFKDAPFGTSYTGTVVDPPKLVQSRDFDTQKPMFWDDGNPKYSVVTGLRLPDGDERSLWAGKPSNLYAAIAAAQKAAGQRIAVGGTLQVTLVGEKPNERDPRKNPIKQYAVAYTPPATPDPLADATPPSAVTGVVQPQAAPNGAVPDHLKAQVQLLIGAGMTDEQIAAVPIIHSAGVTAAAIAATRV